jgi:hypothetical protein
MTEPNFRALCAELLDELQYQTSYETNAALQDRASAALATPPPEPPTDEAWLRLAAQAFDYAFVDGGIGGGESEFLAFARAVLERWGRPTPQPVAVSEHPWERDGWCDEQGRCWWTANKPGPLPPVWWMVSIPQSCTDGIMLPANALPTPEATND